MKFSHECVWRGIKRHGQSCLPIEVKKIGPYCTNVNKSLPVMLYKQATTARNLRCNFKVVFFIRDLFNIKDLARHIKQFI